MKVPEVHPMMKTMLNLIASVAFIATTASCADVEEYREDILKTFSTMDPNSAKYSAQLITAGTAIPFRKEKHYMDEGLYARPTVVTPFANKEACKNFLGIQLSNGETYCNITLFGVWITEYEKDNDALEFILEMESDFTTPLRITIPVFKIPSSHVKKTQTELQQWATSKNVGLVSPLVKKDLKSIHSNQQVQLKFDWLAELLKFGLFKSQNKLSSDCYRQSFHMYVSHPVVLHANTVKELIDITALN